MILFPKAPFRIPAGKKDLAWLLTGGAIVGGAYLWKKWKEKENMKNQPSYTGSGPVSDEPSPFGSMDSGSGKNISLKSVSLTGSVEGLLFSSTISQEYKNETDEALEIIYTFPVGYNTALLGMDATIGDKKLHGEVVKRAEAEERYEEAVEKGDSAIMVQESSMGLYTANLGNIKPGESVTVEIHCAKLLNYDQGQIRIAIPTVIGERYGDEHGPGGLAAHETARPDKNAKYVFSLEITLKGEIANGTVSCPSHQVKMEKRGNDLTVKLDSGAYLDRDFVLLAQGLPGSSGALCVADGEKWMACASFCPRMDNVDESPLALKILVDCSGSMSGMSIGQARKGLQNIMKILSPKDQVSYSRFGDDVEHLTRTMLECTRENMRKLFVAIDETNSDMGGTEMEKAILSTVKDIAYSGALPPVMLLITDGHIWQVKDLVESAKRTGHRIFVIGVGAAPSGNVLTELANQTGGACEFVTENENMAEAIVRMFHRMRGKVAKNIRIDWTETPVWQAELPGFIYDGETVHSFALFENRPAHGPVLSWQAGEVEYNDRIGQVEVSDDYDLARLGRYRQMRESVSESEKAAIALKYQLVSDLTSLVLVYERAENDKIKGLPKIQQVPQMRAHGHGNFLGFCSTGMVKCFYDIGSLRGNGIVEPLDSSWWENAKKIFRRQSDDFELGAVIAEIVALWQRGLFQIKSLQDFITEVEGDKKFDSVTKFLNRLAKNSGVSKEAVYAVMIEMALKEAGEQDRHSLRLLRQHFPDEKKKQEIIRELKQAVSA